MNPELVRNLWLVMTPRRVVLSTVAVALVIGAAYAAEDGHAAALTASAVFLFVVVLFGARDAAIALVGEIRDRTWDQQRLSALGPWRMVWGKLLGGTAAAWYGGALTLAVMVPVFAGWFGPTETALRIYALLWYGLMAQSAALLAALVIARRRSNHSWRDVLAYQATGIISALAIAGIVPGIDYVALLDGQVVPTLMGSQPEAGIGWVAPAQQDVIRAVTLALFLAWAWIGCWRQMRRELQMENGPFVWIAFLAFLGGYAALIDGGVLSTRLAAALVALTLVTYIAIAVEPKDRVLYRWLAEAMGDGRIGEALVRLPAWVYAYAAATMVGAALAVAVAAHPGAFLPESLADRPGFAPYWSAAFEEGWPVIVSTLGFVTRDCGLFVAMGLWRQRGADIATLVVLAVLYIALPIILVQAMPVAVALFWPFPEPISLMAFPWGEALAVWALAYTLLRRSAVRVAS